jgi:Phenazine biosynthesis-like protein
VSIPIYQVDAFTEKPFSGNPAAVCVLSEPRDPEWMQNVAKEMNLSETAFLRKQEDGFHLRWFTPAVEVDLCGHATLASAHVLWETGLLKYDEQARFHTRSGLLTAEHREGEIELNFPAKLEEPAVPPPELPKALGVAPRYTGKSKFDYLVEVDSEETVRNLRPWGSGEPWSPVARPPPASILSPGSSPPARGSTKTRSPVRPIVPLAHSGVEDSVKASFSPTRLPSGVEFCGCEWPGIGCTWGEKPLQFCGGSGWVK